MLAGAAPGACAVAVPPLGAEAVAEETPPSGLPTPVEVAEVGPEVLVADACAWLPPASVPAADVPAADVLADEPDTPTPALPALPSGPEAALAEVLPLGLEAAAEEPAGPESALAPEKPPPLVLAEDAAPFWLDPLVALALCEPPDASADEVPLLVEALELAPAPLPVAEASPTDNPPPGPALDAPAPAEFVPLP